MDVDEAAVLVFDDLAERQAQVLAQFPLGEAGAAASWLRSAWVVWFHRAGTLALNSTAAA